MNTIAKAIVALVGAVGTWLVTGVLEDGIDTNEWWGLVLALATAFGVWAKANAPKTPPPIEPVEPPL